MSCLLNKIMQINVFESKRILLFLFKGLQLRALIFCYPKSTLRPVFFLSVTIDFFLFLISQLLSNLEKSTKDDPNAWGGE